MVVTGGNSGIGKATAAALAGHGADVVITSRNLDAGAEAAEEIGAATGRSVRSMTIDLADGDSTRAFADRLLADHDDLAVLVNNAGILMGKKVESADGFESTFRVNHLGHFHLTCLLRERLAASSPSRVITVASAAHYQATGLDLEASTRRYRSFQTYARSKLANVLFARELADRLDGTGVTSFSVHPGVVGTNLARNSIIANTLWKLGSRWTLTPEQGAITTVYAATDPGIDAHTGAYLSEQRITRPSGLALDNALATRLWEFSETAVGCQV